MSDTHLRMTFGKDVPVDLVADAALFESGAMVLHGPDATPYRVAKRDVVLDDTGKLRIDIALAPHRPWLRRFDRVTAGSEFAMPLLAMTILVLIVAPPVVLWFTVLAAPPLEQLAWAGWAIARAPLVLLAGVWFLVLSVGLNQISRYSKTLGGAFAFLGAIAGFAAMIGWQALFIPRQPVVWPGDYAVLATQFTASTAKIVAVCSAYVPAALVALKLLGLDVLGSVVSLVFGTKQAK